MLNSPSYSFRAATARERFCRVASGIKFLAIAVSAVTCLAQSPVFDVVSIKPNNTVPNIVETPPLKGGRLNFSHASLRDMVRIAYNVRTLQIAGGPQWMATDRYDVNATTTELSVSEDRYRFMLQNMLQDRFHVSAHRETRQTEIYGLVTAKNGPKLSQGACDANAAPGPNSVRCGSANIGPNQMIAKSITTATLANLLTNMVGRPVADKTGLSGTWDIHLDFSCESTTFTCAPAANADTATASIYTALQDQLGLRLESQKGPMEFLVVDHAEKPSEN